MTTAGEAGPEGLLLVDKPAGPTSHDVVGRVRAVLRTRRVGHAGTLDPMASGLLVLAVGRATRLLGHLALTDKSYAATVRLGASTTTDDAQGTPTGGSDASGVVDAVLADGMVALTGDLLQVPSSVSAVKVDGRRAYDRVRAGEQVDLAARAVTVSRFVQTGPARRHDGLLDVDVLVECGSGTYVRALARDLGAALGVGGHLVALRRLSVGPFAVADAVDVFPPGAPFHDRGDRAAVDPRAASGSPAVPTANPGHSAERPARVEIPPTLAASVAAAIVPVALVARRVFPARELDAREAVDLAYGRPLATSGAPGTCAAFAPDGDLVALVADREGAARPLLVWRPAGGVGG